MRSEGRHAEGVLDRVRLARAVAKTDPMALRGFLYQATGDDAIAQTSTARTLFGFREIETVVDQDDLAFLRSYATDLLSSRPDPELGLDRNGQRLPVALKLAAGPEFDQSRLEFWTEQMSVDGNGRSFRGHRPLDPRDLARFTVAVVGAGIGGLAAAVQLKKAGIPYQHFERNPGLGGTWYQNVYPGARVDTHSRAYTHSFGTGYRYSSPFAAQPETAAYLNWVADSQQVRDGIEFSATVECATWDDATHTWVLRVSSAAGTREVRVNAIISCVGYLSRPNVPDFAGGQSFTGPCFHSSQWPAGFRVDGLRVGVIGSGCTSYQLIPEIVDQAAEVTLFQRTPSWVFATKGYLEPFDADQLWLEDVAPGLRIFNRFRVNWLYGPEMAGKGTLIDPDFADPNSLSRVNKLARDGAIEFLKRKLADRPELIETMTPRYPPFATRPVLVDEGRSILDALTRPDVRLVTSAIKEFGSRGITTDDGCTHELDAIVLATGFRAEEFLTPMAAYGRERLTPGALWSADGPRAYLGSMLPGFPNFFMIYGPNTNPVSGLGLVDMEELVVRFAVSCIARLVSGKGTAIEVTGNAYERFNRSVDEAERLRIYSDPRAKSYWKNSSGRSSGNNPFDGYLFWEWLRDPDRAGTDWAAAFADSGVLTAVPSSAAVRPFFGEDLHIS